MLPDGIVGSGLAIVEGAEHARIWTNPDKIMRMKGSNGRSLNLR